MFTRHILFKQNSNRNVNISLSNCKTQFSCGSQMHWPPYSVPTQPSPASVHGWDPKTNYGRVFTTSL